MSDGVVVRLDFVGEQQAKPRHAQLTPCAFCGSLRFDFGGSHAPRYGPQGTLVDCAGRPVDFAK
jgi:hypothetical protein